MAAPADRLASMMRVQNQRRTLELTNDPRRPAIGGPAPSPQWDAFFGAMQNKRDAAFDAGQRFSFRPPFAGLARVSRGIGKS